ncbi:MAG: right-handed parallel beta-helix repeat-containing protein, partial [Balneolales bacterium]|nr:right-handed parallel beta-helix repeat-containing protein [Balneolales bacterium]
GRWTYLGDVFINRDGLIQKQTLDEVSTTTLTWYSETTDSKTHIWANFGDANPNDNEVEINTRAYAFFPEVSGLSYITVKGFIIMNVASHWAPPTVYQPAAIGPNGGNHWIIEDNIILYAKGAAISIGLPTAEADFENRGHHIVRNNVILRAGQGGITGQTWNNKSQIYGNHIEDINYRKEFGGWETAGIKHHGGDSLIIRDNFVRRIYTLSDTIGAAHGIWNDFRNSNWRVTGNVIMDTEGHSILVEANWGGPSLYENNVFANGSIGNYSTSGDAWVHNLFLNTPQSWQNQPWGNRPPIENLRWVNNLFVGDGLNEAISGPDIIYSNNVFTNGALPFEQDSNFVLLENPIQVNIYSTDVGIYLELNQTEELVENNGPLILNGYLEFPFSFDASVKDDFFKKARKKNKNLVGPVAKLKNGINNLPVYEYTDLYKKAVELLEE